MIIAEGADATTGPCVTVSGTFTASITSSGTVVGLEGAGQTNTLGSISSTGGFTQTGAGTTVFSGQNFYRGATMINAGSHASAAT